MKTVLCALAILIMAGYSSAFAVDGYATINGTTTGGEGGPTVTVTNLLDLIKYVGTDVPYNVQLQGSIFCPTKITVKSDKTIVGLGTNATINGNVYVSGVSNIVVQNLFITNPTDDNFNGPDDEDGITVINGANHIWIDHCTFSDCRDGEVDITKTSDWVTVSWCKFFYTPPPYTNGHHFVNLIGADDGDTNDLGTLHVTFHHNWWSTLCVERMPSVRFGRVHCFNNYYNASGNDYCVRTRIDAQCLIENNFFENVRNPWERYVTSGDAGLLLARSNNVAYPSTSYGVTWRASGSDVLISGTDTVFTPPYSYTPDGALSVKSLVTNSAGAGRLPVAAFTANPTNGATAPLDVTFTDTSTGVITDRVWDFGDGTTTNTTETSVMHSYIDFASYDVGLTVIGPAGSNNLSRPAYITIAHTPPAINEGLTASNAVLQVGNVAVVVAGDTNVFNVGATDPDDTGNPLSYQWLFGDGVTNGWSSSNTVEHTYGTNCGPYDASVTISNGLASTTSNFTVVVACQLNMIKLQLSPNFAKTNADNCIVSGMFDLPAEYSFAGKSVTVDAGGAEVSFALNKRGIGVSGVSKFNKPTYNKKTALWKFKATLRKGSWQAPWSDYSITNTNMPKPGVLISNVPVILLLDTEAFMATTNLQYTAKQDKSGLAK
ncbi:MAG TPA: PKD domain-containing protein [Verrucomicrobiae bacterium]|nr:PKD domain-containing protein [Verrucomicrobiae bacterium]